MLNVLYGWFLIFFLELQENTESVSGVKHLGGAKNINTYIFLSCVWSGWTWFWGIDDEITFKILHSDLSLPLDAARVAQLYSRTRFLSLLVCFQLSYCFMGLTSVFDRQTVLWCVNHIKSLETTGGCRPLFDWGYG